MFDRYSIVITDDLADAVDKQVAYEQRVREAALALQNGNGHKTVTIAPQNENGLKVPASKPLSN